MGFGGVGLATRYFVIRNLGPVYARAIRLLPIPGGYSIDENNELELSVL